MHDPNSRSARQNPDRQGSLIPRRAEAVDLGRSPAAMERLHRSVMDSVRKFAAVRHPTMSDDLLAALCVSLASVLTHADRPNVLLLFDLLVRYGDRVSALEIREAVRCVGTQADLMVDAWARGYLTERTGARDFGYALWLYETQFAVTDESAAALRRKAGMPVPPRAGHMRRTVSRSPRRSPSQ